MSVRVRKLSAAIVLSVLATANVAVGVAHVATHRSASRVAADGHWCC